MPAVDRLFAILALLVGAVVALLLGLVVLAALLLVCLPLSILLWPAPAGLRPHAVFVRAPAQAVWDTYFMHVARIQYRPGRRILDIETLSQSPLTIRATIQMDYLQKPSVVTYRFPVYEPPHRYRIEPYNFDGDPAEGDFIETGELVEQDGGTWLRFTVAVPRSPSLLTWLAGRRVRADLRALAACCEGRKVAAPRPPMRSFWWENGLFAAVIVLAVVGAPNWLAMPVYLAAFGVALWRGWEITRRFS